MQVRINSMADQEIIIGVTGGVAAYKTAALTSKLVQAGYGDRVLMSQDIFLKSLLRTYGGPGYGHLIEFFLPRLERHGLPLERSLALMTDNPRRLFEEAR